MDLDDVDAGGPLDSTAAIPNANSPQLLTHLLELVSRGVRTGRSLREALGVDARTVRYYLQAAAWLGLLRDEPDPVLTPEGLAYVYGGARRKALWAAAVERQPFLRRLREAHGGDIPDGDALLRALAAEDPGLAPSTIARRASAVRGLTAPWRDARHAALTPPLSVQLDLPLVQSARPAEAPALAKLAGSAFSPDIYRWMLAVLLDHGELTLGHVRGLLDRAGADEAPLGPYVDLAVTRGDAVRLEDRLIVTRGAAARRDVADSTSAVILSDAGFRAHLASLAPGTSLGPWRPWYQRLLGVTTAADVPGALSAVLRDRSLTAWPRTDGPCAELPRVEAAPFLQVWHQDGLVVALPPSLAQLWEGLPGVNRRLRNARHRTDAVAPPSLVYRPHLAHGGLLHPGEAAPRAVPDQRSLRHRLLSHVPYVALLTALLLAHRAGHPVMVVRRPEGWWVQRQRARLGPLLDVLDGFAAHRGWVVSRRRVGGLEAPALIGLLEALGVVVVAAERLVLDDVLFHQLRADEDELVLHEALAPLQRALEAWLDGRPEEA